MSEARERIVRRKLADGSVKEYRYPRNWRKLRNLTPEKIARHISLLNQLNREKGPRWATTAEAAQYVSCTSESFRRIVRAGKLPPARKRDDGRAMYDLNEIDQAFEERISYEPAKKPERPGPPPLPQLLDADTILASCVTILSSGCGVYFLIADGRIMYVGQSTNVPARIGAHTTTFTFDAWHWVPCAREGLDQLERAYIKALQPPWNKAHNYG